MVFLETRAFIRIIDFFLSDDERFAMIDSLMENPNIGDVIQGAGGVRKMRWMLRG